VLGLLGRQVRTNAQAEPLIAKSFLDGLPIMYLGRHGIVVVRTATQNQRLIRRQRGKNHFPDIARQIVNAERTSRCRVRTDLVRPHTRGVLAIGDIDIRVIDSEYLAMRVVTEISAACCTFPLPFGAEPCSGNFGRISKPGDVSLCIAQVDADNR